MADDEIKESTDAAAKLAATADKNAELRARIDESVAKAEKLREAVLQELHRMRGNSPQGPQRETLK